MLPPNALTKPIRTTMPMRKHFLPGESSVVTGIDFAAGSAVASVLGVWDILNPGRTLFSVRAVRLVIRVLCHPFIHTVYQPPSGFLGTNSSFDLGEPILWSLCRARSGRRPISSIQASSRARATSLYRMESDKNAICDRQTDQPAIELPMASFK